MSNEYRAKWKDDSTREAEVDHFKKLKFVESFLHRVVVEAGDWMDEKKAAMDAGMDPAIALFGHRACGLDANGNPLPESGKGCPTHAAPVRQPVPQPKRKQPYRARIYAPQMMALGARAATLLLDLVPLILGHWKRLVNAGIDPRRLALENNEAKMAALLFEEIGVQYHDLDEGDYDRVKKALDRIEAWIKKTKEREAEKGGPFDGPEGRGGPETGPPVPSPVEGPDVVAAASAAVDVPPQSEKEPDPSRPPAPYSGSGSSLDWTRL